MPQGTVDDNLVLDCLAGPKGLDPYYYRHSTLLLHDLCLEVLTVHGFSCACFGPRHTHTHTIMSYDAVWTET